MSESDQPELAVLHALGLVQRSVSTRAGTLQRSDAVGSVGQLVLVVHTSESDVLPSVRDDPKTAASVFLGPRITAEVTAALNSGELVTWAAVARQIGQSSWIVEREVTRTKGDYETARTDLTERGFEELGALIQDLPSLVDELLEQPMPLTSVQP